MASPAARCLGLRMFASKAFRRTRRTSSVALPRRMRRALFNSGRSSTSKSRRATFGGCHATETRRHRDKKRGGAEEKGGQGDKEKGRRGSAETRRFEFSFSLSPCLLVSLSPCLCGSVALWLVRRVLSRNRRYLRRKRCQLPTSTRRCPTAPLRTGSARSSARRPEWSGN